MPHLHKSPVGWENRWEDCGGREDVKRDYRDIRTGGRERGVARSASQCVKRYQLEGLRGRLTMSIRKNGTEE